MEVLTGSEAEVVNDRLKAKSVRPTPRVTVTPTAPIETTADYDWLPWQAGKLTKKEWYPGQFSYGCTTSFVTLAGANSTRHILTAGHCGENGTRVRLGSGESRMQTNTYLGATYTTADSALLYIGGQESTSRVHVTPNGYREVVAQADAVNGQDPVVPYAWVCHSGGMTAHQTGTNGCGYITRTSVNFGGWPDDQFAVTWTSGQPTRGGDSGGPLYGINPDGTAIALGTTYACARQPGTDVCQLEDNTMYTKVNNALRLTGSRLLTTGRKPFGSFDGASGGPGGQAAVSGWTIDPDLARSPTAIHVYVGGPAGSGAPGYAFTANGYRPDVGNAYPTHGNYHGFYAQVPAPRGASIPLHVYAIDLGGNYSGNTYLGVRNVTVC